ncbi:LacI family DNA-binding transcriptional regulator [Candidatus Enterococcus clewellii]|uniref:HTH gntR-type domain-containing protein n=1 Tax=Candidatus Enterococcus clewellii TaxID=1834193 RepID=A0A242KE05_9ENTE|nr:GntR family transcriptional regulator [Enterococcus sp. 9E7_DIV0242]OTP19401.1 hypothetical protein A5888_001218 [Enterococcus sp. 9E7_DIV0242]
MTAIYKKIYSEIKQKITTGDYEVGEKLPTDKELAETYGTSVMTVSKALNLLKNEQLISRKPKLGSVILHHQESTQEVRRIGFVITDFGDVFGTEILKGVLSSDKDVEIVLKISHGNVELEERCIMELLDLKVSGIILLPCSTKFISSIVLNLVSKNFPLVVLDRPVDYIPASSIESGNKQGMLLAMNHLFENGHENIALISSSDYVKSVSDRIEGYVYSFLTREKKTNESYILSNIDSTLLNSDHSAEKDIERIAAFLEEHPELTAIVTTEYSIANLLYRVLKEKGLSVPDDLSIICFDSPETKYFHELYFTHVKQQQFNMGQQAVDLVLRNDETIQKIVLDCELVEGNSVRNITSSKSKN